MPVLDHVVDQQAGSAHGVDVAAERAVDEEEVDPGRDLVELSFLRRGSAPTRQYISPRIRSSIQALPGACSSGWHEEQHEPAAGFEHPRHLVDRVLERVDVLERQAHAGRCRTIRRGSGSASARART